MKEFKGRVIVPGTCTAEALVSHGGFNTLASLSCGVPVSNASFVLSKIRNCLVIRNKSRMAGSLSASKSA